MPDGFLIALDGPTARPMAGEVQPFEQLPRARFRISLAADPLDQLADARQRPQIGRRVRAPEFHARIGQQDRRSDYEIVKNCMPSPYLPGWTVWNGWGTFSWPVTRYWSCQ